MKGLQPIPGEADLVEAIQRIQENPLPSAGNLKKIILWGQWARFDPRLAEVLVSWMAKHWMEINAFELSKSLNSEIWSAAFGPLLEQAAVLVEKSDRRNFLHWRQMSLSGVRPANGELYWIGLYPFYSKSQQALHTQSHKSYLKWGYLGSDWMINKASQSIEEKHTAVTKSQRTQVLESLLKSRERFTVQEYREALGGAISLRMAQLELAQCPRLRRVGRTKGAFYVVCRVSR